MIFILLVVFQVKHFLADFPFQTQYQLKKFLPKLGLFELNNGWFWPLASHASTHALFTFVISIVVLFKTPAGLKYATLLALMDFIIHFIVDRIKASPFLLGRYKVLDGLRFHALNESKKNYLRILKKKKDSNATKELIWIEDQFKGNKYFWWCLGLDQLSHHMTHYLIIYFLVTL